MIESANRCRRWLRSGHQRCVWRFCVDGLSHWQLARAPEVRVRRVDHAAIGSNTTRGSSPQKNQIGAPDSLAFPHDGQCTIKRLDQTSKPRHGSAHSNGNRWECAGSIRSAQPDLPVRTVEDEVDAAPVAADDRRSHAQIPEDGAQFHRPRMRGDSPAHRLERIVEYRFLRLPRERSLLEQVPIRLHRLGCSKLLVCRVFRFSRRFCLLGKRS